MLCFCSLNVIQSINARLKLMLVTELFVLPMVSKLYIAGKKNKTAQSLCYYLLLIVGSLKRYFSVKDYKE